MNTTPGLRERIAASLVVPAAGRFAAHHWPRVPAMIALYYGADWCAPCHAFVPELMRVHAALKGVGADTDVVYVSLDASAQEMHRYMRMHGMPWPAIDHRRLDAWPLLRALGGPAPPGLVLIDPQGEVIAHAWEGRRYRGLRPVLRTWIEAVSAPDRPSTSILHPQGA